MERKLTVALFGYNEGDHRITRVMQTGKYEMLWAFDSGEAIATWNSLKVRCPEIFLINPAREHELGYWGDYRSLVLPGTIVVKRAQPFGPDRIITEPL